MREFFSGWRRKIGVLTLIMACVAMAGWVRSFSDSDIIEFYGGKNSTVRMYSKDCSIVWLTFHDKEAHNDLSLPLWETGPKGGYDFFEDSNYNWNLQWAGFGIGGCHREATALWNIPYWSIVLPITAISAFLLLSKPRKSNQRKIIEPVPENGA